MGRVIPVPATRVKIHYGKAIKLMLKGYTIFMASGRACKSKGDGTRTIIVYSEFLGDVAQIAFDPEIFFKDKDLYICEAEYRDYNRQINEIIKMARHGK